MSALSNSWVLLPKSSGSGFSIKKYDQGFTKLSFGQSCIGNVHLVMSKRTFSIKAGYSDDRRSSNGSAFIGGFVLGGLLVGTLGCIYAPQISKALAGTDKKELLKKLPNFIYDEEKALERKDLNFTWDKFGSCGLIGQRFRGTYPLLKLKTRQKLAQKIAELNSAIDDVSSQLKSDDEDNGVVPDETEALA